jgi:hypothetical protein
MFRAIYPFRASPTETTFAFQRETINEIPNCSQGWPVTRRVSASRLTFSFFCLPSPVLLFTFHRPLSTIHCSPPCSNHALTIYPTVLPPLKIRQICRLVIPHSYPLINPLSTVSAAKKFHFSSAIYSRELYALYHRDIDLSAYESISMTVR